MKKTIAKIMAAAMVLSTVVAPNAQAATNIFGTMTGTTIRANFGDDALLAIDGVYADDDYASDSTLVEELTSDDITALTSTATSEYDSDGYVPGSVEATVYYQGATTTTLTANNAVTDGTAASNIKELTTTTATDILKLFADAAKVKVTANGEFNDVTVARTVGATEWALTNLDWNGANWVVSTTFNRAYTNHRAFMNQMVLGNSISVRSRLYVNGVDTGLNIWRTFLTNNFVANDDYWNGIVKLKASNNRYTPIRVHYDVTSGSTAAANQGLYVQVVNGTVMTVNGTTALLTTTALASRKVEILDVQADDLAILQSDIAKGKNLMLDKVYLFNVADPTNNNSLNAASAQYIDWGTGQNTSLGTTEAGEISEIHARLFKSCKEKLVNAENVKFINNGAFRKNKQLKKAIIGSEKNIKKINEKAFYDCKKLATVKLSGKTLKKVGSGAFKNCKSNMIFKIKGNSTQVKKAWAKIKKQAPAKAKYAKI